MNSKNRCLRALCRKYLTKLRYLARKRGLIDWVDKAIKDTNNPECKPTEHEVELLARCVNEERVQRLEIPEILGKSYRECVDDEDFERIKKLKRVGVYSKVSAILQSKTIKNGKRRS